MDRSARYNPSGGDELSGELPEDPDYRYHDKDHDDQQRPEAKLQDVADQIAPALPDRGRQQLVGSFARLLGITVEHACDAPLWEEVHWVAACHRDHTKRERLEEILDR